MVIKVDPEVITGEELSSTNGMEMPTLGVGVGVGVDVALTPPPLGFEPLGERPDEIDPSDMATSGIFTIIDK